jgi:hypothetical protein
MYRVLEEVMVAHPSMFQVVWALLVIHGRCLLARLPLPPVWLQDLIRSQELILSDARFQGLL